MHIKQWIIFAMILANGFAFCTIEVRLKIGLSGGLLSSGMIGEEYATNFLREIESVEQYIRAGNEQSIWVNQFVRQVRILPQDISDDLQKYTWNKLLIPKLTDGLCVLELVRLTHPILVGPLIATRVNHIIYFGLLVAFPGEIDTIMLVVKVMDKMSDSEIPKLAEHHRNALFPLSLDSAAFLNEYTLDTKEWFAGTWTNCAISSHKDFAPYEIDAPDSENSLDGVIRIANTVKSMIDDSKTTAIHYRRYCAFMNYDPRIYGTTPNRTNYGYVYFKNAPLDEFMLSEGPGMPHSPRELGHLMKCHYGFLLRSGHDEDGLEFNLWPDVMPYFCSPIPEGFKMLRSVYASTLGEIFPNVKVLSSAKSPIYKIGLIDPYLGKITIFYGDSFLFAPDHRSLEIPETSCRRTQYAELPDEELLLESLLRYFTRSPILDLYTQDHGLFHEPSNNINKFLVVPDKTMQRNLHLIAARIEDYTKDNPDLFGPGIHHKKNFAEVLDYLVHSPRLRVHVRHKTILCQIERSPKYVLKFRLDDSTIREDALNYCKSIYEKPCVTYKPAPER